MSGILAAMTFAMLGAARHLAAVCHLFAATAFTLRLGPRFGRLPMLRMLRLRGGRGGRCRLNRGRSGRSGKRRGNEKCHREIS
ncbi:MAG: hypothetical protein ABIP55_00420 [Tepidisphaeraceae bacterium]